MKNNNNALPKSYNDVEDGVFLAKFIESERRAYHLSDPNIDPGTSTKYNKRRKLELESIDGFTWKYERNINKSIDEQFNLLRIADNHNYPAYFIKNNVKYILKIEKDNE